NLMEQKFLCSDNETKKSFGKYDAMADELKAFIYAVQNGDNHIVSEDDGVETIGIAYTIEDLILNKN
ncbi:MAG: hypothetical protein U9O95_04360, partial [Candidatus Marinimicrobia bacterium]|nr:hypothetical protein [Candidatus Neomarinimicrobiota bacterium]